MLAEGLKISLAFKNCSFTATFSLSVGVVEHRAFELKTPAIMLGQKPFYS